MSARIRFHLDEHMGRAIAEALRRRGIDVTTTPDAGLISKADAVQLDYCRQQARVIVTADPDYIALANAGQDHAGMHSGRTPKLKWAKSPGCSRYFGKFMIPMRCRIGSNIYKSRIDDRSS